MKCAYSQTIELEESKELQALVNLAKNVEGDEEYRFKQFKQDYDIVKKALIHNQKLEEENIKYKKAIEICTNKQVDFSVLKLAKEVEDYNYECPFTEGLLTEEEFNLLKEVFGNERV